jgi:hypothetical protein
MNSRASVSEMLEAAARLRRFARDTAIPKYQADFHRVADDIEIEAIGFAACDVTLRALREAKTRPNVERLPC